MALIPVVAQVFVVDFATTTTKPKNGMRWIACHLAFSFVAVIKLNKATTETSIPCLDSTLPLFSLLGSSWPARSSPTISSTMNVRDRSWDWWIV
jgi:hypothetical protein